MISLLLALSAPSEAGAREDRALIHSLDSEVKALREKLRVYEEGGGCDAMAAPDPIYPELVQIFSGQPVVVTRRGSHTVITLPATLIFPTDEVRVRDEGQMTLDLIATALNSHKTHRVVVTGHVASVAPPAGVRKRYPTNLEFSAGRAAAVALEMIGRYGVSANRVTVAGRGDAEPITSNDTPESSAQNERVVIEIIPGGT